MLYIGRRQSEPTSRLGILQHLNVPLYPTPKFKPRRHPKTRRGDVSLGRL